jgi:hypothetical protein
VLTDVQVNKLQYQVTHTIPVLHYVEYTVAIRKVAIKVERHIVSKLEVDLYLDFFASLFNHSTIWLLRFARDAVDEDAEGVEMQEDFTRHMLGSILKPYYYHRYYYKPVFKFDPYFAGYPHSVQHKLMIQQ